MKLGTRLLSVACAIVLAGCGGGSDDDGGTSTPSAQQFPGGVWVGTAGLGTTQTTLLSVIDGGDNGMGGAFYFAKSTNGTGYDGLYGTLLVAGASLRSLGSTYYSTTDGKFSSLPILVSGTVTGASTNVKTGATISGNYTNPSDTAANSSNSLVPFKLTYSADLYERPSSFARIQGTYRAGGIFGSTWMITVDATGAVTGTNAGCTLAGNVNIGDATHGIYGISLGLSGPAGGTCAQPSTTQSGVAILQYNSVGTKTGIWILTTNQSGAKNTLVLNGTADASSVTPPAGTQQQPQGLWSGTVSNSMVSAFDGVVTPAGDYFFYKPASSGYDLLTGTLMVDAGTSTFSSSNMLYYSIANEGNTSTPPYTSGLTFAGNVLTANQLTASYKDPSASNTTASVKTTYNSHYDDRHADLSLIAGKTFTGSSAVFGGITTTVKIDAMGGISGTTSQNCTVAGLLVPFNNPSTENLYKVQFGPFTGTTCPLLTQPQQTGVAVVDFDGSFNVTGLRILALSPVASGTTGGRSNTVFLGKLAP